MDGFRRIFVGVDLDSEDRDVTAGSRAALRQAQRVAATTGGTVSVLTSTWMEVHSGWLWHGKQVVQQPLSERGRAALEKLIAELHAQGTTCSLRIVEERPWLALTHAVIRGEADVVLVGKRNGKAHDGRRLGSQATNLLRSCPSPVWVVTPDAEPVHRTIVAATDLSPVGARAVRAAARVAERDGAALHVVHAYQIPLELQLEASSLSEAEYRERRDALEAECRAAIEESLRGIEAGRRAQIHIGCDAPDAAIREAVEHLDADLLVMGTISRGGVAGFLVGNTAERLLPRVDCSILTVKPEDFITPVEAP